MKPLSEKELMLKFGFHQHKQSYRGKGKYYAVGGYDLTKEQAKTIHRVFKELIEQDRKAYGELCQHNNTTYRSDGYWDCYDCNVRLFPWSLVQKERQRNQGEKTDE